MAAITRGNTQADEALLTGESTPVERKPEGSQVTAGSYNLQAPVEVSVEGVGVRPVLPRFVALMESASCKSPAWPNWRTALRGRFLVAVLLAAGAGRRLVVAF
jgi:Cu2+-exporting ATPase